MSLPHWAPARKPRRLALWLPFAVALVGIAFLSVAWFWMEGEVERRMEAARASAIETGWTLSWRHRSISGFPFRLDVTLEDARVREPSGWGLTTPILKAEAFVFAPAHWTAFAPDGATVLRRRGGPLFVRAKVLRASISEASAAPPRISVQGLGLKFATPPGAAPFPLDAATEFHFHTKAGPDNQGAVYLEVDGAEARVTGLIARISEGGPTNLVFDAIFSHAKALRGHDWTAATRAWGVAGGRLHVRRLQLTAGLAAVEARGGELGIAADGRVLGRLELALRQAPKTLGAMEGEGAIPPETARAATTLAGAVQAGPIASLPLTFEAGRTTLGPIAIGPAPRIY